MKLFRDIKIEAATNGLIVFVGCRRFVYQEEKINLFLLDLGNYILHPEETEKRFAEKYGFSIGQPEPESVREEPIREQRVHATPQDPTTGRPR